MLTDRVGFQRKPAPFTVLECSLLFAPDEIDVRVAQDRYAFVLLIRPNDCDSVVSRCQVGLAMRPDMEVSHHVDLGPEAIPPIRIQEFDGSVAMTLTPVLTNTSDSVFQFPGSL